MIVSVRSLVLAAVLTGSAAFAAQAQTAAPAPIAEEGPLITMKLEKNCNVRPGSISRSIARGWIKPRACA